MPTSAFGETVGVGYRSDIDGLRAIAVLVVVANHAKFSIFSGGYVGVDVFFVISGYLISRVVASEVMTSEFSIRKFYLRRIRRILPALYVVILASFPLAYWLMLPSELMSFSKTALGAVWFVANFVLWRQGGYFDVDADLKPLLHLWSLSIEEQFYLLYPIAFILLSKLRKQIVLICAIVGTLLSLALLLATYRTMPRASFYLLPTRAWELLTGVVVGLISINFPFLLKRTRVDGLLTVTGLGLIVGVTLLLNETALYPGPLTVIPIAGAALVLWFGGRGHIGDTILSWKPLRLIGLSSYSIYLVHQPVLVFWRLVSGGHLGLAERSFSLGVIIALGVLLTRTFENRYRDRNRTSTKHLLLVTSVTSVVLTGAAVLSVHREGFESRLPPNFESEIADRNPNGVCNEPTQNRMELNGLRLCEFGNTQSTKTVVLIGDSHANAISQELHEALIEVDVRGVRLIPADCSEIPGSVYRHREKSYVLRCEEMFQRMLDYIASERASVVVSIRWTFRLYPIPGWISTLQASNSEGGKELEDYREYVIADSDSESDDFRAKRAAVRRLLDGLSANGQQVVVVGPVPEIAWNIARLNFTHYRSRGSLLSEISIPYADFIERNRFINGVFDEYRVLGPDNVVLIKPEDVFCNTFRQGRCVAQWNTVPYYLDDDHLSDVGAEMLVQRVMRYLN
jgi:peptidoglycan/LPS O-acetylase OafA/YrhL